MSETHYPDFPSESSDDSVADDQTVPEETQPETTEGEESTPEEGSETSADEDVEGEASLLDVYSVQKAGTDPTKSAHEDDESGLSVDEVVSQIFAGKWGNGQEQRQRLAAAGYDHVEVHEAVVARMNQDREK
jgi:hypothetical protein